MSYGRILAVLLLAVLSAGCGLLPKDDDTKDWSARKFYTEASDALADGDYEQAIKYYEQPEARYPFGRYAMQSQLDVAYAHYKNNEPESAIAAADRFIKLHPQNPHVDYAHYLKCIVNYNRKLGLLDRYLPTDQSQRDPGAAADSFQDFAELVRLYPDSQYASDARLRMLYLRNNLAKGDVHVARYYLRRGAYLAAANRGRYVVENFQRTPAVADGLAVMAQGYIFLGLHDLAEESIAVLATNFPEHPAIDRNGQFVSSYTLDGVQRSWINLLTIGLFDPPRPPQFDNRPKI